MGSPQIGAVWRFLVSVQFMEIELNNIAHLTAAKRTICSLKDGVSYFSIIASLLSAVQFRPCSGRRDAAMPADQAAGAAAAAAADRALVHLQPSSGGGGGGRLAGCSAEQEAGDGGAPRLLAACSPLVSAARQTDT